METERSLCADAFCKIALAQALCVAVLLLSLFAVRELFPSLFDTAAEFYEQSFLAETDINEVLENADEV